jgi:transaldolase
MGLTSNPTIFDGAIANSDAYDAGIGSKAVAGKSGEALLIEMALEDLRRAAVAPAPQLQVDGTQSFVKSWWALLARVGAKSAALAGAGQVVV